MVANRANSGSEFLTVAEVATKLRVSNMTIYRLIKDGELKAYRVSRQYRIRAEDVGKYLSR